MRMNAAPSGPFEVSGPRPCESSSRFSGVSAPNSPGWLVRKFMFAMQWSWRFSPTGRSAADLDAEAV